LRPNAVPAADLRFGVSWAHFDFPEQQATSQTPQPVNSQGVPLSGVVRGASSELRIAVRAWGVCGGFRRTTHDAKIRKNSVFDGALAPNGGRRK
jgi:hypothetical protein